MIRTFPLNPFATNCRFFIFILLVLGISSCCIFNRETPEERIGKSAFEYTRKILEFGPRPPGSKGIEAVRDWLKSEVSKVGKRVDVDSFTANTPIGKIEMKNLSVLIPGKRSDQEVILLAHYDSKRFVDYTFVGANDAASSVALLLTLIPEVIRLKLPFDVRIVWVDGEEALVHWTTEDSLYGSRHFADQMNPKEIKAAIVVDMIGDSDLKLIRNVQNAPNLQQIVQDILKGWQRESLMDTSAVRMADDHTPFVAKGVPILHLMDFSYPPWHSDEDDLGHISHKSLSIVGELVLQILKRM